MVVRGQLSGIISFSAVLGRISCLSWAVHSRPAGPRARILFQVILPSSPPIMLESCWDYRSVPHSALKTWVPGIQLSLSGSHGKRFYPLSHLSEFYVLDVTFKLCHGSNTPQNLLCVSAVHPIRMVCHILKLKQVSKIWGLRLNQYSAWCTSLKNRSSIPGAHVKV